MTDPPQQFKRMIAQMKMMYHFGKLFGLNEFALSALRCALSFSVILTKWRKQGLIR